MQFTGNRCQRDIIEIEMAACSTHSDNQARMTVDHKNEGWAIGRERSRF
jgi:hypothetical protein